MATEIASESNAEARLKALFGKDLPYLKDFAQMAWLLSDRKTFDSALKKIDERLWIRYNEPDLPPGTHNRFSRAILSYAQKTYGFSAQNNVVFTGNVGTEAFKSYVLSGVLWKDSLSSGHGEYTHSLQWLAAAEQLPSVTGKVKAMYAETMKQKSTAKINKAAATTFKDTVYLWEWLVDCFPQSRDTSIAAAKSQEGIFSDLARSPFGATQQIIMRNGGELFIADLLYGRYLRRGWIRETDKKLPARDISSYGAEQHSDNTTWKSLRETAQAKGSTVLRTYGYSRDTAAKIDDNEDKPVKECTYYGVKGVISGSGAI